jgi:hypothetical protein
LGVVAIRAAGAVVGDVCGICVGALPAFTSVSGILTGVGDCTGIVVIVVAGVSVSAGIFFLTETAKLEKPGVVASK